MLATSGDEIDTDQMDESRYSRRLRSIGEVLSGTTKLDFENLGTELE